MALMRVGTGRFPARRTLESGPAGSKPIFSVEWSCRNSDRYAAYVLWDVTFYHFATYLLDAAFPELAKLEARRPMQLFTVKSKLPAPDARAPMLEEYASYTQMST